MGIDSVLEQVDSGADEWIARLKQAVEVPSISGAVESRPDVRRMAEWLQNYMKSLSITVETRELGTQTLSGQEVALPPVVLGRINSKNPSAKTLLVYGHYDVQPASRSDGWDTEPFEFTQKADGRMIGRGTSDDKGPLIGWLHAVKSYQKAGIDIPVNLVMCFEGMEESGSEGLEECVRREASGWFKGVDVVCISDNYWLGTTKPCVTYGLRGIAYFHVTIAGPAADLHSGVFGGTVHEPMTDLFKLFSTLVTPDGKISISGVNDTVDPVTEDEKAHYPNISFSHSEYEKALGSSTIIHASEEETLMARWRFPSLSIHGIEGAFYGEGSKTVIPAKVVGKFSIRLVPSQTPDDIANKVTTHLLKEFSKLGSKNRLVIACDHGGKPWVSDTNHYNYIAGIKATERVYGVKPDMTREGGSIPITLTFQDALQRNVLLLPMGRGDDGAHSVNEKLDKSNYLNGIKLQASYLWELAQC